jgi:hypothetical protein
MDAGHLRAIARMQKIAEEGPKAVAGMRIGCEFANTWREGTVESVSADQWMTVRWDSGRVSRDPVAILSRWSVL